MEWKSFGWLKWMDYSFWFQNDGWVATQEVLSAMLRALCAMKSPCRYEINALSCAAVITIWMNLIPKIWSLCWGNTLHNKSLLLKMNYLFLLPFLLHNWMNWRRPVFITWPKPKNKTMHSQQYHLCPSVLRQSSLFPESLQLWIMEGNLMISQL